MVGSAVEVALRRGPEQIKPSRPVLSAACRNEPRRRIQPVSSAPTILTATSRTVTGKAVARMRKAGKVPAVVFGHGLESISVTLDAHEFDLLRRTIHSNSIISLEIDGKDKRQVMVHGIDIDPRTRRLLHVNLFALKSGEEVTVEVPLRTRRGGLRRGQARRYAPAHGGPRSRPRPARSPAGGVRGVGRAAGRLRCRHPSARRRHASRRDPAGRSGRSRGQGHTAARGRGAGGCRGRPGGRRGCSGGRRGEAFERETKAERPPQGEEAGGPAAAQARRPTSETIGGR